MYFLCKQPTENFEQKLFIHTQVIIVLSITFYWNICFIHECEKNFSNMLTVTLINLIVPFMANINFLASVFLLHYCKIEIHTYSRDRQWCHRSKPPGSTHCFLNSSQEAQIVHYGSNLKNIQAIWGLHPMTSLTVLTVQLMLQNEAP